MIGSARRCSACPAILASGKTSLQCIVRMGDRRSIHRPRHCEELLRRSNPSCSGAGREMDCFVASAFARRRAAADAPRNDAVRIRVPFSQQIHVRVLAARSARGLPVVVPLENEGAGNAGCALHPRSRVRSRAKKLHTSIQGSGEHPTFPAQWLYGLLRAHPGELWPLSPPSPRGNRHPGPVGPAAPPQDLTPTSEASGPHAFAVRFRTARLHVPETAHGVYPPCHPVPRTMPPRPPHPIPAFGNDGQRPFLGDRMAEFITVIWVSGKAKFYPTG